MSNKTCATCKFYHEIAYAYFGKRESHMECDGPAASHVDASADDDTNLNSSFRPPPTFGCNGWEAKWATKD